MSEGDLSQANLGRTENLPSQRRTLEYHV